MNKSSLLISAKLYVPLPPQKVQPDWNLLNNELDSSSNENLHAYLNKLAACGHEITFLADEK